MEVAGPGDFLAAIAGKYPWDLPGLKEFRHVQPEAQGPAELPRCSYDFWDVKFYPYVTPGVDNIFAVVGENRILICRLASSDDKNFEIVKAIDDESDEDANFCCAWGKDVSSGIPLLCVAGKAAAIKVFNGATGELLRTLVGHGGPINDMKISPTNPMILATASEDKTIRIWHLDPAFRSHPLCLLAGDGHRDKILSVAFHASGRYLLSGGTDYIVNLWTLPELPGRRRPGDTPTTIHSPHFSSSEIHSNIVDCVAFYHDLILSKALSEDTIVLWRITGFSSSNPPPLEYEAPSRHDIQKYTRSSFSPPLDDETNTTRTPQFERLVQFSIPQCEEFYIRFSLYLPPPDPSRTADPRKDRHPILAIVNSQSKFMFWDLQRLEDYHDYITTHLPQLPQSPSKTHNTAGLSFGSDDSERTQPYTASQTYGLAASENMAPTSAPRFEGLQPEQQMTRPSWLVPSRPRAPPPQYRNNGIGRNSFGNSSDPFVPGALNSSLNGFRTSSPTDSTVSTDHSGSAQSTNVAEIVASKAGWDKKYSLGNMPPDEKSAGNGRKRRASDEDDSEEEDRELKRLIQGNMLDAHKTEILPKFTFTGRQVAWSPMGDVCVAVGAGSIIAVAGRWRGNKGRR